MVFARRKIEVPVSPPKPSNAELLELLRAAHLTPAELQTLVQLTGSHVAEHLDMRTAALKASMAGRDLPESVLRSDLVRGRCHCAAALTWPID
jgi:hypothetical protein